MYSVGVDIIEIERIQGVLDRWGQRFLRRVYTPAEADHCRGRVASLAARFAAKEAVSKALGTGIGRVRWHDIEVLPDARGKPEVRLHGHARQRANASRLTDVAISLSHSREYAVAFVLMWGGEPGS